MARQIEAGKFLVIRCTARELMYAVGTSSCVCDFCGTKSEPKDKGYYIAVLNQWFCEGCFREWIEMAQWYAEDSDIERKNFEFYAPRLGLKCQ